VGKTVVVGDQQTLPQLRHPLDELRALSLAEHMQEREGETNSQSWIRGQRAVLLSLHELDSLDLMKLVVD